MNIKSLLLGSAAALVAVTGAQAADAVVIADPEPVEYVRVCDVYGAGYFYIPGTETCLKISGYVRYQFSGGDLYGQDRFEDHQDGERNDGWAQYTRFTLFTDTGTETELGTLKSHTEVRFQWQPGGDGSSGTGTSLNFAWIELGGFRVGKDESAYTTFLDYAGGVIADDMVPYGPFDTNLISYTFSSGNGFSAIVAVESGATSYDANSPAYGPRGGFAHEYGIDSYVPHIVAGAKFTQGWGGVGVVGAYDSDHENWAVKARLDVKVNETFSAFLMAGWGDDDLQDGRTPGGAPGPDFGGEYNFYKPWGGEWAAWAGFTATLSEKAKVNFQASYDDSEQLGLALNVNYEVVPGFVITPEINYYDEGTYLVNRGGVIRNEAKDYFGGTLRFQRNF